MRTVTSRDLVTAATELMRQSTYDPYGNWTFVLTRDIISVMRERFRAGESAESLSDDYECPLSLVELLVDDLNAID